MVSGNDPVKSFFNSIQVVKESLSPLEVGIQKVAKDLERCFLLGHKNKGTKGVYLIAQVKQGGEFHICDMKKKRELMKIFLKTFLCIFSQNSVCGNGNVNVNDDEVDKKGDGSSSYTNCLKFAVAGSLLVNGFLQALPTPFKAGRRGGDGVEVSEEVEDEEEAEPAVEIGIEEVKGGGRVVMVMTIVMVVVREVSGGRIWD
ncbi:hypothetical protein S83_036607 [Arachis hypogaea]